MIRRTLVGGCVIALLITGGGRAAFAAGTIAEAVKNGDRAAVRTLLKQQADVNASEPDGTTALHWAAYNDDIDTAQLLIQAGANAKAVNRYGVAALSLASTNGSAAMIQALLKAGADPNLASAEGETPLMLASRAGVPAAVAALIAGHADVNAQEKWRGQTALMWAAAEGHAQVVSALIDAGANMKARSKTGLTALLFAVREGQAATVKTLLARGADVNETIVGSNGRVSGPNALLLAVANGHFELASALLDAGADPNAAPQGVTPLHELSSGRKPGVGSNNPPPTGSGTMDSLEMVKRFAAHGANLNLRASGRRKEGGIMTNLNLNGGTPFFFAARTCDVELLRLYASLGADPLVPNEDGASPLLAAAGLGTRSPGEDAGTEPECLEAVKYTMALGNDVNLVDNNHETVMHAAALKNMPSVVNYAAGHGAKVEVWNIQDSHGWTPLRIATGVWRATNFRFDVPTMKAIQAVMVAAGVPADIEAGTTITGAIQTTKAPGPR